MSLRSSIINLLNVILILHGVRAQPSCTGDLEVWDELLECVGSEEIGNLGSLS